ncbi:MAG: HisA/HisF-related TIM barrel protein [Pyrinomonadaceae bacterium]
MRQVFCTDISKDGLLQGSSNALYAQILARLPELRLIASGGVSSIKDVFELEKIGCSGVIIGKAIYEGKT